MGDRHGCFLSCVQRCGQRRRTKRDEQWIKILPRREGKHTQPIALRWNGVSMKGHQPQVLLQEASHVLALLRGEDDMLSCLQSVQGFQQWQIPIIALVARVGKMRQFGVGHRAGRAWDRFSMRWTAIVCRGFLSDHDSISISNVDSPVMHQEQYRSLPHTRASQSMPGRGRYYIKSV